MKNKKRKSFLFSDVNKSNAVVAFLITFGVFAFTFLTSYALFSSETEGANSIGLKASDGSSCYNNGEYLQNSPGDEYVKREGTLTLGKQQTSTTAPDSEKNEIIGNGTYYRTKVDGVWGDWTTTTCNTTDTANCEKFTGYIYRPKLYVWCVNKALGATFEYTGSYQKWTVPATGYYYVELNGASGGTTSDAWPDYSKGARTTGYIKLNKGEVLYVYVGQKGSVSTSSSYNGGGKAGTAAHQNGYSGGGATDIRYFGTSTPSTANLAWNSTLGLNSRIMVAAGGGGAYFGQVGGDSAGGTIWGVDGGYYGRHEYYSQNGKGAKQTAGGAAGYNMYNGTGTASAGTFGVGGDNNTVSTGWVGAGGGGGGYYGGGAGGGSGDNTISASGNGGGSGSSFISGYAGVDAIKSSSSRTATNNTLHYSGKYFVNAEMLQGLNKGNGSAKISYVGPTYERTNANFNGVRYIKDCVNGNNQNGGAHWSELQAIVNGKNVAKGKTVTGTSAYNTEWGKPYTTIVDGVVSYDYSAATGSGSQCVIVDLGTTYNIDEIAVWHYFYQERDYNAHSLYTSSDKSTWKTIIDNQYGIQETSNGIRANAYEEQTEKIGEYYTYHVNSLYYRFTAQSTGYYKVVLKGASGGRASAKQEGYGAGTEGYIKLNKGESLYIYVGGKGAVTSSTTLNETAAGGYNGGGNGINTAGTSTGRIAGSGGGATDIRYFGSATPTAAQLIWNSAEGLNARIMVAGGGSGSWYLGTNYEGTGGSGGTIWGGIGGGQLSSTTFTPAKATQIATNFGIGANGSWEGPGAGGGYYGGNVSGYAGGGGSSFISGYAGVNAITSSSNRTHTYDTLHYTNKYFVDGKMSNLDNWGSGEGRATITYIGPTYPRKNKNFDNVRYIKDCINGNNFNSENNWNELQAIINGKNVAKGKTVTVTATPGSGQSTKYLVDGYLDVNSVGTGTTTGLQCVTVDLGTSYDLDEIAVWHYFLDGRKYNNHSLYTSSNNSTWRALISNESSVYESSNGIRVNAYEATGPMISDETPSIRIKKGTTISDYMTGISAINMNGDDITSNVTHTTINTSTSGKKTVTYTVTDDGMTTTHQRTYTVYDITLTNANATVRVKKGSTINYLSGITGKVVPDNTDVTSSVTYNKIDTSTDGTKTVTYTLSYGGLVKTVTRTYVVYSQYVIVGSNADYTGGFQTRSGSYMFAGTWSISSGVATQVTSPVNWTNAAGGANASTNSAIDLTDYKKLSFQVTSVTYLSKGRIGLSKNLLTSTSWIGDVAENNSTTGTTEKFTAFTTTGTYTIDVSSMTGKYYINFGLVSQYTNSTNKATVKYTNVYLE